LKLAVAVFASEFSVQALLTSGASFVYCGFGVAPSGKSGEIPRAVAASFCEGLLAASRCIWTFNSGIFFEIQEHAAEQGFAYCRRQTFGMAFDGL
jgi:hypothetical protein